MMMMQTSNGQGRLSGDDIVNTASSENASRRAVVRGLAWTAPIVAASVAAPAFASSTVNDLKVGETPTGTRTGTGPYTYSVPSVRVWNDGPALLAAGRLVITFALVGTGGSVIMNSAVSTTNFVASTPNIGGSVRTAVFTSRPGFNPVPVGGSPGTLILGPFVFQSVNPISSLTVTLSALTGTPAFASSPATSFTV